jgi:hypothetical protein
MMLCSSCGQTVPDHARFCQRCGAHIQKASTSVTMERSTAGGGSRPVGGRLETSLGEILTGSWPTQHTREISDDGSRNAPDYAKASWMTYLLPVLIVVGIIWAIVVQLY